MGVGVATGPHFPALVHLVREGQDFPALGGSESSGALRPPYRFLSGSPFSALLLRRVPIPVPAEALRPRSVPTGFRQAFA